MVVKYRRSHCLSQILETLGSLRENAVRAVFIASEFVILGVGEGLGYDLPIFIHAKTGDLGMLTHRQRAEGGNSAKLRMTGQHRGSQTIERRAKSHSIFRL